MCHIWQILEADKNRKQSDCDVFYSEWKGPALILCHTNTPAPIHENQEGRWWWWRYYEGHTGKEYLVAECEGQGMKWEIEGLCRGARVIWRKYWTGICARKVTAWKRKATDYIWTLLALFSMICLITVATLYKSKWQYLSPLQAQIWIPLFLQGCWKLNFQPEVITHKECILTGFRAETWSVI